MAFADYRAMTGDEAVLVGGGAVIAHIGGSFFSGDLDFVAAYSRSMDACLRGRGFVAEDRPGHLRIGWHHPQHPLFGFQHVSGPLFDGRSSPLMIVKVVIRGDVSVLIPSVEDLIADRLAQHAVASPTDRSRLLQAVAMFRIARGLDWDYLERRAREEGGDPTLLLSPPLPPPAVTEERDDAEDDRPS